MKDRGTTLMQNYNLLLNQEYIMIKNRERERVPNSQYSHGPTVESNQYILFYFNTSSQVKGLLIGVNGTDFYCVSRVVPFIYVVDKSI